MSRIDEYTFLTTSLLTGQVLGIVELSSFHWDEIYNNPGAGLATAYLDLPSTNATNFQDFASALWAIKDGNVQWAGIIGKTQRRGSTRVLSIPVIGFYQYFRQRFLRSVQGMTYATLERVSDIEWRDVEQYHIFQDYIKHAQSFTDGNIGVEVIWDSLSGVTRTSVRRTFTVKRIGNALDEIANTLNGFQFRQVYSVEIDGRPRVSFKLEPHNNNVVADILLFEVERDAITQVPDLKALETDGSNSYASAGDATSITGDFQAFGYITPFDWTPTSIQTIRSKWTETGDQRSWRFQLLTDTKLRFEWSTDGTAGTVITEDSDNPVPFTVDGGSQFVQVTLDVDNGAGDYEINFYRSFDGKTWFNLNDTRPDAITDLVATPGGGDVLLVWTEPAANPSIGNYDVERSSTGAGSGFAAIATDIDPTTSYIDTTAAASTQYWYRVHASSSAGDGDWSNVATATTGAAADPPVAISDLAATAGSGEITLDWTAPASTETITSYDIQRSTVGSIGPWNDVEIDLAPAITYDDTGLTPDTEYWYRVRATSSEGDGPWSNIDSAVTTTTSYAAIGTIVLDAETGFTATHTFDLPTTVTVGERLLAIVSAGHQTLAPSGTSLDDWTLIHSDNLNTYHAWRVYEVDVDNGTLATALSGGTIVFTTTETVRSTCQVIPIMGATSGVEGTAFATSTGTGTGFGNAPNSDSATAGWGSDLNLWLSIFTSGGTGANITTVPTNYTLGAETDAAGQYVSGSAWNNLESATEDPGAYLIDDDENWQALTIVYKPGAGGTGGLATISRVGVNTYDGNGTFSTTHNIPLPTETIVAGDLIEIFGSIQIGTPLGTAFTATGYSQAWFATGGAVGFRAEMTKLYLIASGGESGNVTVTIGGAHELVGGSTVWRGVDNTTPYDATEVTAVGLDPASITTVTDGAIVNAIMGGNDATLSTTVTKPTGYTDDVVLATNINRRMHTSHKEVASFGAENPATYTWPSSANSQCVTDALRPGPGGGDPGGGGSTPGGTPAPSIPALVSATTITTAQNAKTIIEAGSDGDHFELASGTHTSVNGVLLKSNMHVRLATGCILEGNGLGYAFRPNAQSVTNVSITGDPAGARPIIRNYGNGTSAQTYGAIMGRTDDALAGEFLYLDVDDWFISGIDFDQNASNGIKMGSNFTIYDCEFHGHSVTGVNGDRYVGGLVHSCLFYWNALNPATGSGSNGAQIKLTWANADVGRTSITTIDRTKATFVISNCTFEALDRDGGPGDTNIGIWFDLDCQDCLVEYSTFDDHPTTSIFAEGCNDVEFAFNEVRNSDGFGPAYNSNFINGAISFGESTNCYAHDNIIRDSTYALVNRMSNRTIDWYTASGSVNYAWPTGLRYWILNTQTIPSIPGQSNMWTGANTFENNTLVDCTYVVINEGTDGSGQTTHGSTDLTSIDFIGNDYQGTAVTFYNASATGLTEAQWKALSFQRDN